MSTSVLTIYVVVALLGIVAGLWLPSTLPPKKAPIGRTRVLRALVGVSLVLAVASPLSTFVSQRQVIANAVGVFLGMTLGVFLIPILHLEQMAREPKPVKTPPPATADSRSSSSNDSGK